MTKAHTTSYSPRQAQLCEQMNRALEKREEKHFSLLQAYWVHRYGLLTMPIVAEFDCFEPLAEVSSSFESCGTEDIEYLLESQEKVLDGK